MFWLKKGYQATKAAVLVVLVELLRISPLIVVVGAFLALNNEAPALRLTITVLSGIALVLAFAHVVRKALFPYLDLKGFFDTARRDPGASAYVILGVLSFLAFLVWLTISISLGAR